MFTVSSSFIVLMGQNLIPTGFERAMHEALRANQVIVMPKLLIMCESIWMVPTKERKE